MEKLVDLFADKKVLILGFGKEGQSSYRFIRRLLPELPLTIGDSNPDVAKTCQSYDDPLISCHVGENYLDSLEGFDLIIKTPSIPSRQIRVPAACRVTSQTDIFLSCYHQQVIGVTGTKGKSTTASLLNQVLKDYFSHVLLVGNIGVPPFDLIYAIREETLVVYELSSYQLEQITVAPRISVLLNLYQEHLDHHGSYKDYQAAKLNILTCQQDHDCLVFNTDDKLICNFVELNRFERATYSFGQQSIAGDGIQITATGLAVIRNGLRTKDLLDLEAHPSLLPGLHNRYNMAAVACVCRHLHVPDDLLAKSLITFKGLEHRLEFAGEYEGKKYYNDSIATIPEATMEAISAIGRVDTLVLGGYNRGIDYSHLAAYLSGSDIPTILLTGPAGAHIASLLKDCKAACLFFESFDMMIAEAIERTPAGGTCLLSPAASSYGAFKNFEERGKRFKRLISTGACLPDNA